MGDDLLFMQREAARRVQRMQEHSRRVMEQHRQTEELPAHAHGWPGDIPDRTRRQPPPSEQEHAAALAVPPDCAPKDTALSSADSEQWFLLGLALLLFRSGCQPELLLALLYLALTDP